MSVAWLTTPSFPQNALTRNSHYLAMSYWTNKREIAMDQFYVQCHSNRIPLHLVKVKDLMSEHLTFLRVVGIQVTVFSHFRAWSITWPCGSKEKMVSLLRLTQLSVWSPAITMESMITLKSSQLSQQCLTQTLINSPKIQNSFAHLDSFWNRGKRELVNGPLHILKAEERTHHS